LLRLTVPPGQKRERIDVYLTHHVQNATRTKVQRAIAAGQVLVNTKKVKSSTPVLPGDLIEITLSHPPAPEAKPEDIPLDIVYEDEHLLVVNKPAGMVTHPAYGHYTGTLVNALLFHCGQLADASHPLRAGIVHRLDKETSGLLVVAKTDTAHTFLAKQFAKRTIEREYWAIVWGTFRSLKGMIDAPLGRSKKDRKKFAVTRDGKHAATEYEVVEQWNSVALVRLKLHTGRTHQIRVHLSHIGHPVLGDPTYEGRNEKWTGPDRNKVQRAKNLLKLIPRQALHAKTIGFTHPVTKELVRFDSPVPEDMAATIAELRRQKRLEKDA
jgi:23S rRNA pseudouridine1911/1915/1917 synthase